LTDVVGAYNQSLLSEATIDVALKRLYQGLVKAGYFDPPANDPYRAISWTDVNTPTAQDVALRSAAEGMVLLKNDGTLPINFANRSVAVIGHWANATSQMLGGYSGYPPYYHNAVYAVQQLNLTYYYAPGPVKQNSSAMDYWTAAAMDAAGKADVILYFGGNDQSIASEDKDRVSIAWPDGQLALINKLAGTGKPLVVVELGDLNDDTPLLQNANVSAVLWAGYPGQSGGTAALNIITGKTAPAGRLPITMYPASYTDAVPLTEMALRPINGSSPGRTYRWYNASVLPFGYGLQYSSFQFSFRPEVPGVKNGSSVAIKDLISACNSTTHLDLCPVGMGVGVTVRNRGPVTSDSVILAFLSGQYGPQPWPIKTLATYARAKDVAPDHSVNVTLPPLTLGSLARTDLSGNTVLYPGKYKLMFDVPAQFEIEFELIGDSVVLDLFPQPK
jgi:beta-D-xylosidase 4